MLAELPFAWQNSTLCVCVYRVHIHIPGEIGCCWPSSSVLSLRRSGVVTQSIIAWLLYVSFSSYHGCTVFTSETSTDDVRNSERTKKITTQSQDVNPHLWHKQTKSSYTPQRYTQVGFQRFQPTWQILSITPYVSFFFDVSLSRIRKLPAFSLTVAHTARICGSWHTTTTTTTILLLLRLPCFELLNKRRKSSQQ
jgi:hypothetical protein